MDQIYKIYNYQFIEPIWNKLSLEPIRRKERDKRMYYSLYTTKGISGLKKMALLLNHIFLRNSSVVLVEDSLGNYIKTRNGA
jgi:hypothetical protein